MQKKNHNNFSPADKDDWQKLAKTVKNRNKNAPDDSQFFNEKQNHKTENTKKSALRKTTRSPIQSSIRRADNTPLPELAAADATYIDAATERKIKRGQCKIDQTYDLHAYSGENAWRELLQAIPQCYKSKRRCIRIITGKGSGALQKTLPRILNHPGIRPVVLYFCEAAPKDGGAGAFYVYLKKHENA